MGIKKYRQSVGLTQKQFSQLFEIPIDVVKSWDSGRRNPPEWAKKLIIEKLKIMEEEKMKHIKFKGYSCNYDLWIGEFHFSQNTDGFSVGNGEKYDFTVDECVEADMDELKDRLYNSDAKLSKEEEEEIREHLEFYYSNKNNWIWKNNERVAEIPLFLF